MAKVWVVTDSNGICHFEESGGRYGNPHIACRAKLSAVERKSGRKASPYAITCPECLKRYGPLPPKASQVAAGMVEYLDWSDQAFEKYECGEKAGGRAELSFSVEDGNLVLHLRRETATRRNLTVFVGTATDAIYETLKAARDD